MKQRNLPTWNKIHTLIFDFDGVFTDNKVFINQEGLESVQCSRADSLGLDILKRFNGLHDFMRVVDQMKSFATTEFTLGDIVRGGLVREYLVEKTKLGLGVEA